LLFAAARKPNAPAKRITADAVKNRLLIITVVLLRSQNSRPVNRTFQEPAKV
jgi:hypothetical protein